MRQPVHTHMDARMHARRRRGDPRPQHAPRGVRTDMPSCGRKSRIVSGWG